MHYGAGAGWKGPFINEADDGMGVNSTVSGDYSYISELGASFKYSNAGEAFSSPSRQVPSAGILGSLPTGVKSRPPWQTLLFNPVPATRFGVPASARSDAGRIAGGLREGRWCGQR